MFATSDKSLSHLELLRLQSFRSEFGSLHPEVCEPISALPDGMLPLYSLVGSGVAQLTTTLPYMPKTSHQL